MNFSTILGTINFLKGLNNPDKDKIVSNLADTFFYALKNTLSNFDEEDKTTTFQIKEMISLEKKEIISLINDLIKTENSFNKLLNDSSFIESIEKKLNLIIPQYHTIDSTISRKIVNKTIKKFQQKIYEELSNKQGIYILLQTAFQLENDQKKLQQILEIQINKLKEISENTSNIKSIPNQLLNLEQKIQNSLKETEDNLSTQIKYISKKESGLYLDDTSIILSKYCSNVIAKDILVD